MDIVAAEKDAELRRNLGKLQELIAKFKTTVEGLFIHGSCSFWSVYGGLEKAQDDLWEILCFGLRRKRSEISLRKELSGLLQPSAAGEDTNEDSPLQDWINNHLLNYSMSAAIERDLVGKQCHPIILNLYEDYAALRNVQILSQIVIILKAVELNNLALLGNLSHWLLNKEMFVEKMAPSIGQNQNIRTEVLSQEGLKQGETTATPPGMTPNLFAPVIQLDTEQTNMSPKSEEEEPDLYKDIDQDMVDATVIIPHKPDKSVSAAQITKNVLMKSALAAVMESNEDDVIWYDSDRYSLTAEPVGLVRSRLLQLKELSRSETSLFDEKVLQTAPDANATRIPQVDIQTTISSDNDTYNAEDTHSDMENRTKLIKRPSSVKRGHSRSKSDQIGIPKAVVQPDSEDGNVPSTISSSLPVEVQLPSPEFAGDQGYYYQPEDGYMFPKPYEGQSLISYLNSRSYDTGAELDKENAHFSICEALITAIEQMKCSKVLDSDADTSDEEIETLRQKIQERKLRRRLEKLDRKGSSSDQSRSGTGKSSSSVHTTTSRSSSRCSSFQEDQGHQDENTTDKLSRSWENLTLSTAKQSMVSEKSVDKLQNIENSENSKPEDCSAEAIAKSLLKKFSTRKLPAASELKWVVSEDEVPQSLLPFPTSWPVSPDDASKQGENDQNNKDYTSLTSTRGNVPRFRGSLEWAPPRAQIVFVLHPVLKRKVILQRQAYRCAGCGLKVSLHLSKRFRYCEYFGKFFCTSCHSNQTSVIPARILLKWDFKKCPVSDFAFDLLKKIHADPLFDVTAINSNLHKSIKVMGTVKDLGIKMHYIRNFLQTCRHTAGLCQELDNLRDHLFEEEQKFSLDDLIQIKRGDLTASLKSLVSSSVRHIRDCQLCKAKGSVCEFCKNGSDILYPYETNRVAVCSECKTCYHRSCFIPDKCPKCIRLKARERMRDSHTPEPT